MIKMIVNRIEFECAIIDATKRVNYFTLNENIASIFKSNESIEMTICEFVVTFFAIVDELNFIASLNDVVFAQR